MKDIFGKCCSTLQRFSPVRFGVALFIYLFFLTGCAYYESSGSNEPEAYFSGKTADDYPKSVAYEILEADTEVDVPGYRRIEAEDGGLFYVADQAVLESYDNWQLLNPIIRYNPRHLRLIPSESSTLSRLVMRALWDRMGNAGFEMANSPSACTVTTHLEIANLRLFKTGTHSSQSNYAKSLGSFDAVFEIRDLETEELLVFFVSHIKMGGGSTNSGSPNMTRFYKSVVEAVDKIPSLLSYVAVDEQKIDARSHLGCQGAIGKRWKQLVEQKRFGTF